jgi:hypothetical protein
MGAVPKIDWAGEKHIGVNCLTTSKPLKISAHAYI